MYCCFIVNKVVIDLIPFTPIICSIQHLYSFHIYSSAFIKNRRLGVLWHPRHSLSSFIWLEWDVFSTCFCILLRITCWQLWQMASNSHILWCLQPEHTPNVSGVSDTHLGLTSLHMSTFTYEMSWTRLPPRASTGGIKVRWKGESLHLCSGWMSVFLKASGRGWTTQSVEMPTTKPNSRLILSETNCKQGVQELVMLFLYVHWLIKCGMNGWMEDLFRPAHEWHFCFSYLQRMFPVMSRTSQSQQTELISWPVQADFLTPTYISTQVLFIYLFF